VIAICAASPPELRGCAAQDSRRDRTDASLSAADRPTGRRVAAHSQAIRYAWGCLSAAGRITSLACGKSPASIPNTCWRFLGALVRPDQATLALPTPRYSSTGCSLKNKSRVPDAAGQSCMWPPATAPTQLPTNPRLSAEATPGPTPTSSTTTSAGDHTPLFALHQHAHRLPARRPARTTPRFATGADAPHSIFCSNPPG